MTEEQRTSQQNKALHKWCSQISQALNEQGLNVEQVIKNFTMELQWTPSSVKEILIRTAIRNLYGKESTTQLKKVGEIDKLIDGVTHFLAKIGIEYIPFPSMDEVINETEKELRN